MKTQIKPFMAIALSAAILSSCNSGSSNNNNNQVGANAVNGGYCQIQGNTYYCSETSYQYGQQLTLNTPQINFVNQQDLCTKMADNFGQTNKDVTRGLVVAQSWRQNYVSQSCGGSQQTWPTYPTTPTQSYTKTINCQTQIRRGGQFIANEEKQIQISNNGGNHALTFGYWRWFKFIKLAQLNLEFIPAMSMSTDSSDMLRLSMSAVDGSTSVSSVGFAGAENRIEIMPNDSESNQTQVIVSCRSADANKLGQSITTGKYACRGVEVSGQQRKEINYTNQLSDVIQSGLTLSNSVFIQGQPDAVDARGLVEVNQNTSSMDDSNVSVKTALMAPMSVNIEKIGYSLKLRCSQK